MLVVEEREGRGGVTGEAVEKMGGGGDGFAVGGRRMRAQGFEGGGGSSDGAQSRYVAAATALSRVSEDEEGEGEKKGLGI